MDRRIVSRDGLEPQIAVGFAVEKWLLAKAAPECEKTEPDSIGPDDLLDAISQLSEDDGAELVRVVQRANNPQHEARRAA